VTKQRAPLFDVIGQNDAETTVCTTLAPEQAAERIQADYARGKRWRLAESTLLEGTPQGSPCPIRTSKHWLFLAA
jgi:hypothetical protein